MCVLDFRGHGFDSVVTFVPEQTHLIRFTRELAEAGAQPMPDQARDALVRYVDAFNRWEEVMWHTWLVH